MSLQPFIPGAAPLALKLLAATADAGVSLINGTQTIVSWSAPADGKNHRVHIIGQQRTTGLQVGGQVAATAQIPDGSTQSLILAASGLGVGFASYGPCDLILAPGGTLVVAQLTALTLGAAVLWTEIWGV